MLASLKFELEKRAIFRSFFIIGFFSLSLIVRNVFSRKHIGFLTGMELNFESFL